jgi:hypothetical protein
MYSTEIVSFIVNFIACLNYLGKHVSTHVKLYPGTTGIQQEEEFPNQLTILNIEKKVMKCCMCSLVCVVLKLDTTENRLEVP